MFSHKQLHLTKVQNNQKQPSRRVLEKINITTILINLKIWLKT